MSKRVEEHIENYTNRCSNEVGSAIYREIYHLEPEYSPWLTPDHARSVAQIAREEVIEKISHWIEEHCYDYLEFGEAGFGANFDYPKMINDLKKAMEEKI